METGKIGCIIMASGLSARYGRNKLLEKLGGREVFLHTAEHLISAGLSPLTVTRSQAVKALLDKEGMPCVIHDGARKSDTMHVGLARLETDIAGILFMPGDQPLVLPESIRRLMERFAEAPERPVRLGFRGTAGSPVLFPGAFRSDLMAYTGDRGGIEVLRERRVSCDIVEAEYEWELWDVDTPDGMAEVLAVFEEQCDKFDKNCQS